MPNSPVSTASTAFSLASTTAPEVWCAALSVVGFTIPMRRRSAGMCVWPIVSPSTRNWPDVGNICPSSVRAKVVLPQPLGPSRAQQLPRAIRTLTPSRIACPWRTRRRSQASTARLLFGTAHMNGLSYNKCGKWRMEPIPLETLCVQARAERP